MENLPLGREENRLLRLPEVVQRTGLARATIYNLIKREEFPRPIELTGRLRRWQEGVIEQWLADRRVSVPHQVPARSAAAPELKPGRPRGRPPGRRMARPKATD